MTMLTMADPARTRTDRERYRPRIIVLLLAAFVLIISSLVGCGGSVSTTEVPPQYVSPDDPAYKGSATLTWTAPSTNIDGTVLTTLAGYKVYYGTTLGIYASVDVGYTNSYQVVGLTKGQTYYFAVTAYDTSGNESDFSMVVSKVIG
jgi:hypothetical protein